MVIVKRNDIPCLPSSSEAVLSKLPYITVNIWTAQNYNLYGYVDDRASHRLPRDNQRDREQQMLLKSISSRKE